MDRNTELIEVSKLLSKDIDKLGVGSLPETSEWQSLIELKVYLMKKLSVLLDTDYDKLINTLYLIDLNEEKLHKIFSLRDNNIISAKLADLIIDRQMEKIHFRRKYKEGKI
jgi:hypothetical protein